MGGCCDGERGFWIPACAGMTGGGGFDGGLLFFTVVLRCGLVRATTCDPVAPAKAGNQKCPAGGRRFR